MISVLFFDLLGAVGDDLQMSYSDVVVYFRRSIHALDFQLQNVAVLWLHDVTSRQISLTLMEYEGQAYLMWITTE